MAKVLNPSPAVDLEGATRRPSAGPTADPPASPSYEDDAQHAAPTLPPGELPPEYDPSVPVTRKIEPRPPVVLIAVPSAVSLYRVGDGPDAPRYLAPRIVEQVLVGGVAGVRMVGPVSWDLTGLAADMAQQGKILIPWSMAYCAERPRGSGRFLCAWDAIDGHGRVVHTVAGAELYRSFLEGLMDRGVLPRPTEPAIAKLLENTRATLHMLSNGSTSTVAGETIEIKSATNPRHVATIRGDIAFLENALTEAIAAGRTAPPTSTPAGFVASAPAAPVGFAS